MSEPATIELGLTSSQNPPAPDMNGFEVEVRRRQGPAVARGSQSTFSLLYEQYFTLKIGALKQWRKLQTSKCSSYEIAAWCVCAIFVVWIALYSTTSLVPNNNNDNNNKNSSKQRLKDAATTFRAFARNPQIGSVMKKPPTFVDINGAAMLSKEGNLLTIDNEIGQVFVRGEAAVNAELTVVFLHGQKFSSADWDRIGTLHSVATVGHFHAVAIDLPGYGRSSDARLPSMLTLTHPMSANIMYRQWHRQNDATKRTLARVEFIRRLFLKLGLLQTPVVVVFPSMSGAFGMPLLVDNSHMATVDSELLSALKQASVEDKAAASSGLMPVVPIIGAVPVSPVIDYSALGFETMQQMDKVLSQVSAPLLITFGDKDNGALSRNLHLMKCPIHEEYRMKNAAHACYLDNPKEFNARLVHWIKNEVLLRLE